MSSRLNPHPGCPGAQERDAEVCGLWGIVGGLPGVPGLCLQQTRGVEWGGTLRGNTVLKRGGPCAGTAPCCGLTGRGGGAAVRGVRGQYRCTTRGEGAIPAGGTSAALRAAGGLRRVRPSRQGGRCQYKWGRRVGPGSTVCSVCVCLCCCALSYEHRHVPVPHGGGCLPAPQLLYLLLLLPARGGCSLREARQQVGAAPVRRGVPAIRRPGARGVLLRAPWIWGGVRGTLLLRLQKTYATGA